METLVLKIWHKLVDLGTEQLVFIIKFMQTHLGFWIENLLANYEVGETISCDAAKGFLFLGSLEHNVFVALLGK